MPTVRVHHADGLWLADLARPGALRQLPVLRERASTRGLRKGAPANFKTKMSAYRSHRYRSHATEESSRLLFFVSVRLRHSVRSVQHAFSSS